jgi:hypothetical protein
LTGTPLLRISAVPEDTATALDLPCVAPALSVTVSVTV